MSRFKVKMYKSEEMYDEICDWWSGHNFPKLPIGFLPEECFVASKQEEDMYAVFLYHTDSQLCWLAFPVSNPKIPYEEREGGLSKLIEAVTVYAKKAGYEFIFTTTPLESVKKALVQNEFAVGDEGVNHYIKIL